MFDCAESRSDNRKSLFPGLFGAENKLSELLRGRIFD